MHKQTIEDYFREHPPEKEKEPCSLLILNAITHELITITNETYINAQSVCDLLWKITRLNLDTRVYKI